MVFKDPEAAPIHGNVVLSWRSLYHGWNCSSLLMRISCTLVARRMSLMMTKMYVLERAREYFDFPVELISDSHFYCTWGNSASPRSRQHALLGWASVTPAFNCRT